MFDKIIKTSLYGLVVVLFILFFHYLGWLRPIENLTVRIFSPVQEFFYSLSQHSGGFYDAWLKKRDLLAENEKLRGELAKLSVDYGLLKSLEEENSVLKKELNFIEEKKQRFIAAKIISGVSDPLTKSVIINRGSRDGIEKGLAVISQQGVVVGKVIEVNEDFSKVLLLSDNRSKVAVKLYNLDHTVGLVEGSFGLSFSMTNIPQNQQIEEGDLVVTSGLEGKIPNNLPVAKVESVKSVESEIFKTAILSPIIPFDSLSYVLVIIP